MSYTKHLGVRIKQLRVSQGLSQYEFGRKIGQQPQVISLYEQGKMEPRLRTLQRLMTVFAVAPEYFFAQNRYSSKEIA